MTRKRNHPNAEPKLCPICGKTRGQEEFERHHVVWRMDGGSDDPTNLLDICKTCHAIITRGCTEDRVPRDAACFALTMSIHGLTFLLKSNIAFSEDSPWGKAFVEKYTNYSPESIDKLLKYTGEKMYDKYMRQIHGALPALSKTEAGQ